MNILIANQVQGKKVQILGPGPTLLLMLGLKFGSELPGRQWKSKVLLVSDVPC